MALQMTLVVNGVSTAVTLYPEKAYQKVGKNGPYEVLPAFAFATAGGFSFRLSGCFIVRKAKEPKEEAPKPNDRVAALEAELAALKAGGKPQPKGKANGAPVGPAATKEAQAKVAQSAAWIDSLLA